MALPSPIVGLLVASLGVASLGLAGCAALVDARATSREAAWRTQNPPEGQFMEVDGHRVHYVERGSPRAGRPSLVLIHGANGNTRDLTFGLTARLESDYHVIVLDRPGLGWSDTLGEVDNDPRVQARHLQAAVRQLGVRRPVVVGQSYGGSVAMAWALEDEDNTAALVLIAAPTYPWEGQLGPWYRINDSALGRPARNLVAAFAPESYIEEVIASIFAPQPVPQGYNAYIGSGLSLQRATLENNTRQVNALNGYLREMHMRYSELSLPIEQVHGDADTTVGLEIHSRRLAEELPNATLQVLEGVGHMPHHTTPDDILAAIERAVSRAR